MNHHRIYKDYIVVTPNNKIVKSNITKIENF